MTIFAKITSTIMAMIMFLFPSLNYPKIDVDVTDDKTNYDYVFVHGLGGWGQYDIQNNLVPYWGVTGGDLIKYLNARGYNCYAASVNPTYSAWDRACELYAQLTGTKVDYGKEHSERCNHKRFGTDYSRKPLIKNWSAENKINLLGHSFGGATVLLLLDLLKDGSEAERNVTDPNKISGLFTGGKEDYVYSVTMLSAPMNGSSAYYIKDEITNDPKATFEERLVSTAVGMLANPIPDGRADYDCAGYDLSIDGAQKILENIETIDGIYYFSQPCSIVEKDKNGNWTFNRNEVEIIYRGAVNRMANWTGVTPNGFVVDETWQPNDGLVNTVSAIAPIGAPRTDFDINNINTGIYNVFETYHGDHMSLMGDLIHTNNIREYYANLVDIINNL